MKGNGENSHSCHTAVEAEALHGHFVKFRSNQPGEDAAAVCPPTTRLTGVSNHSVSTPQGGKVSTSGFPDSARFCDFLPSPLPLLLYSIIYKSLMFSGCIMMDS